MLDGFVSVCGFPARRTGLRALPLLALLCPSDFGCTRGDVLAPQFGSARGDARPSAMGSGDPNLAARFSFEEGEGFKTGAWVGGKDRQAEFANGVSWTTEVPSALAGSSAFAVRLGPDQFLYLVDAEFGAWLAGEATLSFWCKTLAYARDSDPTRQPAVAVSTWSWGTLDAQGRVGFQVGDAAVVTTKPVNDGGWHHVAITYQWGSRRLQTFTDGVPGSYASVSDPSLVPDRRDLRELFGSASRPTFEGQFDDVRIYDTLLTLSEITNLAQGRNADGSDPGR